MTKVVLYENKSSPRESDDVVGSLLHESHTLGNLG